MKIEVTLENVPVEPPPPEVVIRLDMESARLLKMVLAYDVTVPAALTPTRLVRQDIADVMVRLHRDFVSLGVKSAE